MSRWFRVYDSLIDDPKFIKLGPDLRSALLTVWCVASQNNGRLPPLEDVAIKFRLSKERTRRLLDELRRCGFIDDDDAGSEPHNWGTRQHRSDNIKESGAERARKYREKKRHERDASQTVTRDASRDVTPVEQNRTEQSRTEHTDMGAERPPDRFEEFWKFYPKRDGSNPKQPAEKRFRAAVKSGTDPQIIIDAVRRYAAFCLDKQQAGTPYVAQAVTWLNQQRWTDYPAQAPPQLELVGFYAEAASRELEAWDAYRQKTEGKSFPRDARGGWRVPAQWPPDREDAA